MKKIFFITILIILLLCISCDSEDSVTVYFEEASSSGTFYENTDESEFHFNRSEIRTDVEKEKTITLFGREYIGEYSETIHIARKDQTIHRYILKDVVPIVSTLEPSVYYNDAGEFAFCSGFVAFETIQVDSQTTREEIEQALKTEFGDWIDFSKYNKYELSYDEFLDEYTFSWWSDYNGYETPISLSVDIADGKVEVISYWNGAYTDEADFTFPKTEEELHKIIEEELKKHYNTDETTYLGYEVDIQQLTEYDGKKAMYYRLEVNFELEEIGETGVLCYMLITA